MTPEQYERWLDFSQRMALKGHSNLTEARRQRLYADVTEFIRYHDNLIDSIEGWDQGDAYVCDRFNEWFGEHYNYDNELAPNRYHTLLACCLRAGLDVAAEPSAGVIGYTVGDVRRMYDGNLPDWFLAQFDSPQAVLAADDNEGVWL